MKGLVIRDPWITLILEGGKTWEVRSTQTKFRGEIALIKAGTGMVFGVAEIVDSSGPFDQEELERTFQFHKVPLEVRSPFENYTWRYAWALKNIQVLPEPVPYQHRNGAVIFTTLDDGAAQGIDRQLAGIDVSKTDPPFKKQKAVC